MIRPFKTSDEEQLIEIVKLNIPKYFDEKEVNDFKDYLDEHKATYFTVEYENKIVGGTGYYVNNIDKSGRITWLFFHPDATGKGLGKQAVEHCLDSLKSNSESKHLIVTTSHLAHKFFEKFGFKVIKTEKDYWGQGLDLYLMEQYIEII